MFADQGFADDVGVCKGGCWVVEEMGEVYGFVGEELKEGVLGCGEGDGEGFFGEGRGNGKEGVGIWGEVGGEG